MSRSVVFVACVLAGTAARAQSLDEAARAEVEAHLRRGVELRRAGHDDESLAEFVAAHRIEPSPRTRAQLGLARQAVGDWLDADRLLRESLAAPDDPWVSRHRASLESVLAVTATHLGTIDVRANVAGATLRLDGSPVVTLPAAAPLHVLAGMVSMEVSAPGYVTVLRRFVVDPGANLRESVELLPEPPPRPPAAAPPVAMTAAIAPPPRPASRAPVRPWWRRWAWAPTITGGAALALAGVAVAVREDAAVRYNAAANGCPPAPPPQAPGACAGLAATATTWEAVAWTAGLAGASLLVAGVTMFALPGEGRRAGVAFACAPAGAGVRCALSF
jgi:hypothetical protein